MEMQSIRNRFFININKILQKSVMETLAIFFLQITPIYGKKVLKETYNAFSLF